MIEGGGRGGERKDQDKKKRKLIAFLVFGLMLANNASVIVGRYTRILPAEEQFDISHLVVVTEAVKLLFSFVGEYIHTTVLGNDGMALSQSLKANVLDRPLLETFKLAIPASLFLVQNSFFYVALSNLSAPLFQVTYQGKILTTALVSVVMLGRKYSIQKWICLALLSLGVALAVGSESKNAATATSTSAGGGGGGGGGNTSHNHQSLALGLTAIAICSLCGALAGVYFEKILKNNNNSGNMSSSNPSVWLRNMQLSFFALLLSFLQKSIQNLSNLNIGNNTPTPPEATIKKPYYHGFTVLVCTLVVLRASAGLLGGMIIKHADNVIKGISNGVSVVIGCVVSTILFGTPLTSQFGLGAALVLASCFFFSNPIDYSSSGFFIHYVWIFKKPTSPRRKRRGSKTTTLWCLFLVPFLFSFLFSFRVSLDIINEESNVFLDHTLSSFLNLPSSPNTMRSNQTSLHHQQLDLSGPPKDSIRFHVMQVDDQPDCGGCVALRELTLAIIRQGYDVTSESKCPLNSKGPLAIIYYEGFPKRCQGDDVVHIHWMLAPMGIYSNPSFTIDRWWSPDDLVFHYGGDKGNMNTKIPVPHTNTLTLARNPQPGDDTDPAVLQARPHRKIRTGAAVIIRKGPKFHPEIMRAIEENSTLPHEILNLGTINMFDRKQDLRLYEYFFSYDPYTFWSLKAAMLGTVSIVYPVQNRSEAEWVKGQYVGSYLLSKGLPLKLPGIAYGFEKEEIEHARKTMHQLRPLLAEAKEWGYTYTVMRMIRDSFRWLNNGERDNFEGAVLARDFYDFKIKDDRKPRQREWNLARQV